MRSRIDGRQEPPASSVVNLLTIEGEDQVQLKVTVAEVNRNTSSSSASTGTREFSIGDYRLRARLTELPSSRSIRRRRPTLAGIAWDDGTLARLRRRSRRSSRPALRTLAEPTLTAISGESASFLAGGEFPVPVAGDNDGRTSTVEFKPFGVALAFTPGRPVRGPHQPARQDRGLGALAAKARSRSAT